MERKIKRRRLGLIIAAIVVSFIALNACLKDGDNGLSQISATAALNAVPGSEGLDIGLDQNQLNNRVLGEEFAYGDTLPYKNAYSGRRLVRVFDPNRNQTTPPLAQGTVDFTPGKFYSLYVVGYEEIQLMVTEDDLSNPSEGKAKIRFLHLSPDAPALDLEVEEVDTLLASNKKFKEVTEFSVIDAGDTYTFNIIEYGSDEVVHSFDFTPASGMIYTIWAKGLLENTNDDSLGFGHGIITH
ncbi:DUF4397 domain-containing protein [Parapedobacter tibetensis]|uniref:DUF4397 domain-containing protein n=1 Tax=Parapedobacter tibetensis TaxID=2972951 RepID=UPI00214D2660|nr:DUF4397 domain-containing protein [Parapedobacter tibetensis]